MLRRAFSHIYVEDAAADHPRSKEVLARFPKSEQIYVRHYKDVFNRKKQLWPLQRESRRLILARRRSEFLYQGSPLTHAARASRFFYSTPILNCVYDCAYCYLQGMFPSANVVLFVNFEDFQTAIVQELERGPFVISPSYDTDLPALEPLFGECARWLRLAGEAPGLTVEFRTKSAGRGPFSAEEPLPNVVLSWTVSPEEVVKRYEHRTAPLQKRLEAAGQAAMSGWRVRLCIDPMLQFPDDVSSYERLVDQIFGVLPAHAIEDVHLGVFRMTREYFENARTARPDEPLFFSSLVFDEGSVTYPHDTQERLVTAVQRKLLRHISEEKIVLLSSLPANST